MSGINLKGIQSELLSMMKDIHQICVDNDIQYSLTGGSLLGAIRESGFIPWDDDIDIMMDRTNYFKLCSVLRGNQQYILARGPWLQHIEPESYSSDIEPYIDIFIVDRLPDSNISAKLKILLLRILQGMLKEEVEYDGFSILYKVCIFLTRLLGKLFTRQFKLKLYDKVSQIGNKSDSRYISITNDSFALLTIKHDSHLMDKYEEHVFEDTEFMVTYKYTDYLTNRYGKDYMIPPDEKDRIQGQHINRHKVSDERIGI